MTSLTVPAADSVVYYLRVHPPAAGSTDSGTLDLSHSARTYPLQVARSGGQMASNPPIDSVPAWVSVNISNGTPGGAFEFTLDGSPTVLDSGTFDDDGQAVGATVLLDDTVTVGTHQLTVTDVTTSLLGVLELDVLNGAAPRPPLPGGDAPPTPVATTQWVLENSGVEVYVLPINPARMTSPHAARVITVEHSTAPDGQPMTFEGMPLAADWSFEGNVATQAHYEALERFLGYNCRLWLTDHFGRAWVISLESVDFTPTKAADNPWAFSYRARAFILDGPVAP